MQKIVYCATDQTVPGTKGGSTHVLAVAEGLAALGHEVHVAATPGDGGFPKDGVHWHAIAAPLGKPALRMMRTFAIDRLIKHVRPDIIIERYHNFGGESLRSGGWHVLEVNAPIVDYPDSPKQRLDRALLVEPFRRWRDWQCRTADRFVVPTRAILPRLDSAREDSRDGMGRRHPPVPPRRPAAARREAPLHARRPPHRHLHRRLPRLARRAGPRPGDGSTA